MGPLAKIHVSTDSGAYDIEAEAVWVGTDLLVYIYGGEKPHIGAVSAAQPRPSLKDVAKTSATASVITFLGHKEDMLAKEMAERLASRLNTNVIVTAGIHWDALNTDGVNQVLQNSIELADRLINAITKQE